MAAKLRGARESGKASTRVAFIFTFLRASIDMVPNMGSNHSAGVVVLSHASHAEDRVFEPRPRQAVQATKL